MKYVALAFITLALAVGALFLHAQENDQQAPEESQTVYKKVMEVTHPFLINLEFMYPATRTECGYPMYSAVSEEQPELHVLGKTGEIRRNFPIDESVQDWFSLDASSSGMHTLLGYELDEKGLSYQIYDYQENAVTSFSGKLSVTYPYGTRPVKPKQALPHGNVVFWSSWEDLHSLWTIPARIENGKHTFIHEMVGKPGDYYSGLHLNSTSRDESTLVFLRFHETQEDEGLTEAIITDGDLNVLH